MNRCRTPPSMGGPRWPIGNARRLATRISPPVKAYISLCIVALRSGEDRVSAIHLVYDDQWDLERVMGDGERSLYYLKAL